MKSAFALLLVGVLLATVSCSPSDDHTAPNPDPAPAPDQAPVRDPGPPAKLIFSSEFDDEKSIAAGSQFATSWPLGQEWDSPANEGEVGVYVDMQGTFRPGPNPFSFQDGVLSITATPTPGMPAPRTYTSGLLCTAGKFSFTYGYVEARCKVPGGAGFWPLVWMMKDPGDADLTWPPEIDILQCSSRIPTETYDAVLWGEKANPQKYGAFCKTGADLTADFHTYGMEWTPVKINWFIDGKLVLTHATPAGVDAPMFLMVNLAVGDQGDWIGKPDGSTRSFQIDYLRVYDKKP
jgi:beta-glucanase (GH16 family)